MTYKIITVIEIIKFYKIQKGGRLQILKIVIL